MLELYLAKLTMAFVTFRYSVRHEVSARKVQHAHQTTVKVR